MAETIDKISYFQARIESTYSPMDLMSAQKENPQDYFIIDVRNAPNHLKKEKIADSHSIPLNELEESLDQIPKDKEIVVYCWDVWCNMGAKAALILSRHGFRVRELSGGIAAWKTLALPIENLED